MLEFETKDLEIYKANLCKRKKTFQIEYKRNERSISVNGKKVAKLKQRNSISPLLKDDGKKVLNLFASVKKSVNGYLVKNNFSFKKINKKYNSSFRNSLLFKSLPNGTKFIYVDVKHCYWRIAFLMGYISPYFYEKIVGSPDMKLWRNMALSCIIAPRKVEYYRGGESIGVISEDTTLYQQVYENIRFYAWNIFGRLCFEKIGKENCIGYFTDGIMVFPEDLAKVKTALARNRLQYRIIECEKISDNEFTENESGVIRKF